MRTEPAAEKKEPPVKTEQRIISQMTAARDLKDTEEAIVVMVNQRQVIKKSRTRQNSKVLL